MVVQDEPRIELLFGFEKQRQTLSFNHEGPMSANNGFLPGQIDLAFQFLRFLPPRWDS